MSYIYKAFIVFCISIFIQIAYSESNCGMPLCLSSNVIKPGVPLELSWHKSDNQNGLQISLLYGDNSDKTDCHLLQGQQVLRAWKLSNGEEEYSITFDEVDFEIENKTFVFLVEYLASNFCMMAPSGPKGLGTSYVVFDKSMPVKLNNSNDGINNDTNDNTDNNPENNGENGENGGNGKDDEKNKDKNSKDKNENDTDDKPGFLSTFTSILFIILGLILLLIAAGLILLFGKKFKGKDKNSNADSLKQNSTTRMLSPSLTDDAFAEDSVYSAVDINTAIPPPQMPQNPNDPYIHNISVESFNSSTSQSGLISRHEAKMIAERFRCELQNPLNNEADDASSIREKEESV
ncbi:hypothetical protein BCR32DRAFT_286752 [Anaeromyces robustus]|uniref:Uncharacterized protein n=1 Tax=Anaeromyces robustus TaxID=1754192 RepID=A0A1Y1VUH0_9FUNG|nr:hypothetical protein BCR32DRAFT_286752 [Anaeromyces robustus]|eukprot:ORX64937.1 hypothetical protein BCR32DRAFT_286752 [Anaeromyces robustus]